MSDKKDIDAEKQPNPGEEKQPETPSEDKEPNGEKQFTENENKLYARAKSAEDKVRELKDKLKELSEEPKPEQKEEPKKELSAVELAKQVKILSEYSDKEIEIISDFAKAKGISEVDAVKDENVKIIIEAIREKIKKEDLTPSPSSKQAIKDKSIDEIARDNDFSKMSQKDREEFFKKMDEKYRK